jgi:gliding motility-associated-like protein
MEHTYLEEGVFDVLITVTSDSGCIASHEYNEMIEVLPFPNADFYFSPDEIDIMDTEVTFYNTSSNGFSYEWSFGTGDLSNVFDPIYNFPNTGAGEYIVELKAFSEGEECFDVMQKTVTINEVLLYYIPNTFTPDGDLFNESFKPVFYSGLDIYDYHLTIFNRWGEPVFESYDANYGWDGTMGGNELVPAGVYVWSITFGDNRSDEIHKEKGHITVLR